MTSPCDKCPERDDPCPWSWCKDCRYRYWIEGDEWDEEDDDE